MRSIFSFLVVVLLPLTASLTHAQTTQSAQEAKPRATVIWISIDGMRFDYADRFDAAYLKKLMAEGAFSKSLAPVFPSITFPNHSSQATGTTCDLHGITDNQFRDSKLNVSYTFPNPQAILTAEPIWTAAQRQGVRTAVEDWPLSYQQKGEHASAYFARSFNGGDKDEARLARLITDWKTDKGAAPIRLLMGYVPSVDTAGHRNGPEAAATGDKVRAVDKIIRDFHEQSIAYLKQSARPGDSLYFVLSTDHGMEAVTHLVNSKLLLAEVFDPRMEAIPSGPLLNLHLDFIADSAEREKRAQSIVDAIKKHDFVTGYTRKTMPAAWGYNHPTRSGDVILMLKNGYKFDSRVNEMVAKTDSAGTHGYPVETCPNMMGLLIVHRYPEMLGGKDLGAVDNLQLHPTVAKWLEIKPSDNAKAKPIELK